MIKAQFKSYGSYVTDSVYQWDLNQKLSISGLVMSSAPVIAYSSKAVKKAITVQSKIVDGVINCDIPNALLQFDNDITAHLCSLENKQYKAVEKMIIPVIKRAMPADYLFTDNVPILTYEAIEADIQHYYNLSKSYTDSAKSEIDIERKRIDNIVKDTTDNVVEYKADNFLMSCKSDAQASTTETTLNVFKNISSKSENLGNFITISSALKIQIKKSGLYSFDCKVQVTGVNASTGRQYARLKINDVQKNEYMISLVGETDEEFTNFIVSLNEGDTISFTGESDFDDTWITLYTTIHILDYDGKVKIPDITKEVSDIRVGEDGTVYGTAGEAVRKQIGNITEDLDNIAFIGFQYLNSADGERNKYYYSYGNKKSTSDSHYVVFPIISLPAGKYYIQNLSDVFTFFDDGTSIKKFSGYNAESKTLDLDISRKISITGFGDVQTPMTISNVKASDNKYGVISVKIIGDNTSERIQTAENNIKSLDKKVESIINSEKRHIITVGNEKDFVSIKEAVASITDSSKNNIYDIYIDDGVYEEYAITLPDYVNLIGASGNREKCVIKGELPDSASANEITVNSTLNLKDSNVLENLTITAKNLRYPIHSESGGTHTNWVQILNNCYVEHFGNTSPNNTWTSYHAWGEGSSSGAYAEFNNCIFKSPAEPWYVHEFAHLPDIPRPYHHVLNNCQIINTTVNDIGLWLRTAKIDNTKNSDIINTIDFNNCVFYNGEISINNVCPININIHGSNNVAIRVKNEYPNTDYTNIKTYVGTEPIKKGTILKYGNGINLVEKANESTPVEMIAGVAVEDCESNTLVKIIKGTYVVASYRVGTSVYCDNDGQITDKGTHAIGISYGEFSLIN